MNIDQLEQAQAIAGGKRTSASPKVVGGVTWLCWTTGINFYERRAIVDGKLLKVRQNYAMSGYNAVVGDAAIPSHANPRKPHRFTSEAKAMEAAIRAAKGS